ncbi:hypothetical protein PHLCEN_2v6203 [Hermanssonia centrifuga]|uniref:Uncharacterized protein n=1 Tax=Hermanssonia centrifuga TaxID=98765 RepID=A0A2R6P0S6_9APHY|nr:hypothetical protein PHLCEN_2v6203 [Hermanssonia centrifuga]
MAPIRIGFIGLSTQGWAASGLVPSLFDPLLSPSYTLTALCTSSPVSASAAASKYSELAGRPVKAYHGENGFTEIANDPEVDMVAVSIKIPDHFKAVWPAIEAGKDIFIEWTVGNGLEETVKIAEAAKKKGLKVLVGAQANHGVAINKAKELVESGRIGRVLSTTAILSAPFFWGKLANPSFKYGYDIDNGEQRRLLSLKIRSQVPSAGATPLTIPVGHFIVALSHVLGEFTSLSAHGIIAVPTAKVIDAAGNETGEIFQKTAHDQVAVSGVLRGNGAYTEMSFANIHARVALGEQGRGRTLFKWIIDGEDGTIELREDGTGGGFVAIGEKRVFLNGEEVKLEEKAEDRLGNSGKAWLEFAKGAEGKFFGIDDAVRLHRAVDAAQKSINEGRTVVL